MKKILAVALAALLAWTGVMVRLNSADPQETQVEVNDRTLKKDLEASVLIHIKLKITRHNGDEETGFGTCSGVYVSEKDILTAGHCVPNEENLELMGMWVRGMGDSQGVRAGVVKVDHAHDLALLHVENPPKHGIVHLAKKIVIGEDVRAIGCPLGFEFLVSKGVVSSVGFTSKPFLSKYTIHTAMINPGSSGGGLFNMKGELIGINTMTVGMFGWMGISMAVSIEDVTVFLGR